ncbi:MAG: type IX secretion system membrane protein PorP/SprF [Cytophagales bacterium]|nr:type IX secretion system membrane protein PorP/SprF [Cytophagales bacterium]
MKKINIICLFLNLIVFSQLYGQSYVFDQFVLNNYLINPAISGIENYVDIQVIRRAQWKNVEGAPTVNALSMHMPISNDNVEGFIETKPENWRKNKNGIYNYSKVEPHHGIGFQVLFDEIGPFSSQVYSISYAYHLTITGDVNLALGIATGINKIELNTAKISSSVVNDPAVTSHESKLSPQLNFGGWLYSKSVYFGASMFSEFKSSEQVRSYMFTGGIRLPYQSIVFKPYTILRISNKELSYDLGIQTTWNSVVWLGVNYRSVSDLLAFVGFNANAMLSVSYLWSTGFSESITNDGNTQEISLQIRLRNREKVNCQTYY